MSKLNLLGQRFGRLTVTEEFGRDNHKNIIWKCKCDCGKESLQTSNSLKNGVQSCGCLRYEIAKQNLIGKKFNRLMVVEELGRTSSRGVIWRCICDCGNETKATTGQLNAGKMKSCGCYIKERVKERATIHGMSHTRLYKIWQDAKTRCNNPNTPYFYKYGGRGITFSKEWEKFIPFMDWALKNGYQDDLTLDRIDVNGNYEPINCRWISNREQQYNKRTNHLLTFKGKTQSITEWGIELGINPKTLQARIMDYHWSTEKALTTPVKQRTRRTNNGI